MEVELGTREIIDDPTAAAALHPDPRFVSTAASEPLPQGRSLNIFGRLNAAQELLFERKRRDGMRLRREELLASTVLNDGGKKCLERIWTRRAERVDEGFMARCMYLVQRLSELKERTMKNEGYMDHACIGMLGILDTRLADDDAADGDIAAGTTAQPTVIGNAVPPKLSEARKLRLYTQATVTMELLEYTHDRDLLQIGHLEDAMSASEEAKQNNADMTKAKARMQTKMNDASIIRL